MSYRVFAAGVQSFDMGVEIVSHAVDAGVGGGALEHHDGNQKCPHANHGAGAILSQQLRRR